MPEKTRVVHVSHEPFTTYIGRAVHRRGYERSIWANPYPISATCSREDSIYRYRAYILGRPELLARLPELRGKVLGCWCKEPPWRTKRGRDVPCHGDVLAELADALPEEPEVG